MSKFILLFLLVGFVAVSPAQSAVGSNTVYCPDIDPFHSILVNEGTITNDPEMEELFLYLRKSLRYPNELRENSVQSHMVVFVQVDDKGTGVVQEIIGENHEEFSEQIISLFEKYPGKWDASYFGETIAMPFIFQKHKGKELVPPSMANTSFDKILDPVVVTGYDATRKRPIED